MDALKTPHSGYIQMAKSTADQLRAFAKSYPLLHILSTGLSSFACLVCVVGMYLLLWGFNIMCMEVTPTWEACQDTGLLGPLTQFHGVMLCVSSVCVALICYLRAFKVAGHMENLEKDVEATLEKLKYHRPFYTQLLVGSCTLFGAAYLVYFALIINLSNLPRVGHSRGLFDKIGTIMLSLIFPSGALCVAKYYLHLWTLEVLIQELADDVKSGGIKSADVAMGGGTSYELIRRVRSLKEKAKEVGKMWEPLVNLNLIFWGIEFITNLAVVIHARSSHFAGSDVGGSRGAFLNCIVSMIIILVVLIPLVKVNSAGALVNDACDKHGEMFGDLVIQNAVMDFLGGRGRIRITVLFGMEISSQHLLRILSAQGTALIGLLVSKVMHLKHPKA